MAITTAQQTSIMKASSALFNKAFSPEMVTDFVSFYESNGNDLGKLADALIGSSVYTAQYAGAATVAEYATILMGHYGLSYTGTTAAETNMKAFIEYSFENKASWATSLQTIQAVDKYLTATFIPSLTTADTTWGTMVQAIENKATVATNFKNNTANSGLELSLASVTSDPTTVTAAGTTTAIAGGTFSLTTSADVLSTTSSAAATKTTDGNDTIYALTDQSLTSADIINAGSGTDTLTAAYATAASVAAVLTSVENLVLRQSANASTSFDAANSTGLTSITFDSISEAGNATAQAATNIAAGTTLGITNKTSTDADTFSFTFADAALSGATDTVTLTTTAIGTATGAVTIKNTTANLATSGAETVKIVTTGTGSSAASTLGSLVVTSADGTTESMTTLVVEGTSNLTITGTAIDFKGTTSGTVTATSMSGDLALDLSNGENITFTGGSGKNTITTGAGNDNLTGGAGNDTFTIGTGNDTVVGGAGDDRVVVTAITELTSLDSIALGDGTRDTMAIGTWTAVNTTNFTTANKALLGSGVEVIELTATNVTAVDFAAISQDIVRLSAGDASGNVTVSNVLTNDTLILTADHAATTGAAMFTASGATPNQTFKVELYGAGIDVSAVNTAATDHAIEIASNITTLQIDSSKASSVAATTANTIGGALNAGAFAIANTSAQSLVITGNHDLTIANTAGVTFKNGIDVNAATFTGVLTLAGSASADIIKGGTGNDILTGLGGNDTIDLSAGGNDKVVFSVIATNGRDTISSFTSGDKINIALLGDGSTTAVEKVVTTAMSSKYDITDSASAIINTDGTAANIKTGGTATVSDWTNLTQVAAYLQEAITVADDDEYVFVVNVGSTTYVYDMNDADDTTIDAADLALVGVIANGGTALDTNAVVVA